MPPEAITAVERNTCKQQDIATDNPISEQLFRHVDKSIIIDDFDPVQPNSYQIKEWT